MANIITSGRMQKLATLVEEAARSTEEGVKHFVEPAEGTLRRATSRRHHIVFGRRGSGKSSLLRKCAADLTVDRRPIAYVDLEPFKGHSYPDVLLSVLIATFREFSSWLQSAALHPANRRRFWDKFFGKQPTRPAFKKTACLALARELDAQLASLQSQLHATDDANLRLKQGIEQIASIGEETAAKVEAGPVAFSDLEAAMESDKRTAELEQRFRRSKVEFLRRHILDYQEIFRRMVKLSGGDSFLLLDDLYHIRRIDQPRVVDYFHSIAKDRSLWLKVGTIRHRTDWYTHGDPPIGVKLGDDADEIDLDLTLEKYSLAKEFLKSVLSNFSREAAFDTIDAFLTRGAIDRLVLASGGVARDFLSVFRRSIDIARERGGGHRGTKIGVEDVNVAAGEYDSSKREEFKRDTSGEEEAALDEAFQELRDFCLEKANSNCFLLDKDEKGGRVSDIHELVDLKLLHLIRSRVTVSGRKGRIYEVYLLDLSQYAGARKRRGLDIIEFWKPESIHKLRRASLIYSPPRSVRILHREPWAQLLKAGRAGRFERRN